MTTIAITDVTNKTDSTDGTGVFDLLMESTNLQLQEQYNEGRLTGGRLSAG